MSTENNEYKTIVDMIKVADEQYTSMYEMYGSTVESTYGMIPKIMENILGYTVEELETLSNEEMIKFISRFGKASEDEETNRNMLLAIKKDYSIPLYQTKTEMENIKKQASDVLDEYNRKAEELSNERTLKEISELKEKADSEENLDKKKEITKKLSILESTMTMSFIFNRFEELGVDEIQSVMAGFFDEKKGSYVIKKFKSKTKLFGLSEKLYLHFYNIEEIFLPEEYHIYNNLFLFLYLRMIAYADPYRKEDKMYINAITNNLSKLFYHKFDNGETELKFIEVIKKFDDQFKAFAAIFEEENTTHPKHPTRIELEQKRETQHIQALKDKMDELHITGYEDTWTSKELQEYLNDQLDKLIKTQGPQKETTGTTEVVEAEDGTVTIEPALVERPDSEVVATYDSAKTASGTISLE